MAWRHRKGHVEVDVGRGGHAQGAGIAPLQVGVGDGQVDDVGIQPAIGHRRHALVHGGYGLHGGAELLPEGLQVGRGAAAHAHAQALQAVQIDHGGAVAAYHRHQRHAHDRQGVAVARQLRGVERCADDDVQCALAYQLRLLPGVVDGDETQAQAQWLGHSAQVGGGQAAGLSFAVGEAQRRGVGVVAHLQRRQLPEQRVFLRRTWQLLQGGVVGRAEPALAHARMFLAGQCRQCLVDARHQRLGAVAHAEAQVVEGQGGAGHDAQLAVVGLAEQVGSGIGIEDVSIGVPLAHGGQRQPW
ncbi:hypothetical protein D3C71_879210 [compost metagenome]